MIKERLIPETLSEAIRFFADKDAAFQAIVQLRWPDGRVTCPRCGAETSHFIKTRKLWTCVPCDKQFSVKVGTIFEDSPLGLDKWLPAIWLLANAKNGISSYELSRALGVTQKTGWFMLSRIRLAMQSKTFAKMSGTVEADETFVGGKAKNMHRSKVMRYTRKGIQMTQFNKSTVFGMLERKAGEKHSTVHVEHVKSPRRSQVEPHIEKHIAKGSEVYTDALPTYHNLPALGLKHAAVDHALTYVRGQVHTNGLENFWSLLKRSIKGTYVSVDPFHLFRYCDEQTFRFNHRALTDGGRFLVMLRGILGRRLTYADLISADMAPATT